MINWTRVWGPPMTSFYLWALHPFRMPHPIMALSSGGCLIGGKKGFLKLRVAMMLGTEAFRTIGERILKPHWIKTSFVSAGENKLDETTGTSLSCSTWTEWDGAKDPPGRFPDLSPCSWREHSEAACSALEYALKKSTKSDHRHRMSTAPSVQPSLAKKSLALGSWLSPNLLHLLQRGRYLRNRSSRRIEAFVSYQTLLKSDVKVAASRIALLLPRINDRELMRPAPGWPKPVKRSAEEKITVEEALRMYGETAAELFSMKEWKVRSPRQTGRFGCAKWLTQPRFRSIDKRSEVEMTILMER